MSIRSWSVQRPIFPTAAHELQLLFPVREYRLHNRVVSCGFIVWNTMQTDITPYDTIVANLLNLDPEDVIVVGIAPHSMVRPLYLPEPRDLAYVPFRIQRQ